MVFPQAWQIEFMNDFDQVKDVNVLVRHTY